MQTADQPQHDHVHQDQQGAVSRPNTLNKYIVLLIISSPAIFLALAHMRHLTSFFEKNAEQTVLIVAALVLIACIIVALACLIILSEEYCHGGIHRTTQGLRNLTTVSATTHLALAGAIILIMLPDFLNGVGAGLASGGTLLLVQSTGTIAAEASLPQTWKNPAIIRSAQWIAMTAAIFTSAGILILSRSQI